MKKNDERRGSFFLWSIDPNNDHYVVNDNKGHTRVERSLSVEEAPGAAAATRRGFIGGVLSAGVECLEGSDAAEFEDGLGTEGASLGIFTAAGEGEVFREAEDEVVVPSMEEDREALGEGAEDGEITDDSGRVRREP